MFSWTARGPNIKRRIDRRIAEIHAKQGRSRCGGLVTAGAPDSENASKMAVMVRNARFLANSLRAEEENGGAGSGR